jgi:hypothetical protein
MAETWKTSLTELRKFIADNPSIEIDPTCVSISGDMRPEFYKLFDRVRTAFLRKRFAPDLEKASAMSTAWAEASKAVKEEMRLEDIEINASLNWFLKDPVDGLMRGLFDPLFDLLKGKTDEAGFVKAGDAAVGESFKMLFREGYESWGSLALLHLLAPDRLWLGKTSDFYTDPTMEGDIVEGNRDDWVNDPFESKKLVFDNLVRASFVVPGALIHSARLNTYVGLRPRWYLPRWKARMISDRQDWIDLKKLYRDYGTGNLWPDMLINTAEEGPEDLKLVADFYRLARPDAIIEFMEEDNWWDARQVESIMRHNLVMNPRYGTFVISRVTVPAEAFKPLEAVPVDVQASPETEKPLTPPTQPLSAAPAEPAPPPMARPLSLAELPDSVHIISAGYDIKKLEPVAQALVAAAANAKEVYQKSLQTG